MTALVGNLSPSIQSGIFVTFGNEKLLQSAQGTDPRRGGVGFCLTLDSVGYYRVNSPVLESPDM